MCHYLSDKECGILDILHFISFAKKHIIFSIGVDFCGNLSHLINSQPFGPKNKAVVTYCHGLKMYMYYDQADLSVFCFFLTFHLNRGQKM